MKTTLLSSLLAVAAADWHSGSGSHSASHSASEHSASEHSASEDSTMKETYMDAKAHKTSGSHSVTAKSSKLFKSSKSAKGESKSAKAYSKASHASSEDSHAPAEGTHASADSHAPAEGTHASAASHASASGASKSAKEGAHASAASHHSASGASKSAKEGEGGHASAADGGCAADYLDAAAASAYLDEDDNKCAGAKLALDNKLCVDLGVQPQAGANVTVGYVGTMDVGDIAATEGSYLAAGMCPVNVHWHLGAEHLSVGEYDEGGDGPSGGGTGDQEGDSRRLSEGPVRAGFRCHHYDGDEATHTEEYDWQHCVGMEVGETYEVHWPHSAAGACGTIDQYQTPFYDGVFCNLDMDTFSTLGAQDIAAAVGVHAQVFTIVNDEAYFYPDMMRGMIVDAKMGMGTDVTKYTGSTTGTSRDNEMCSTYAPITWQVDRKCHAISASSFDKMCHDMKLQRDDMHDDLYAHGARELVDDAYVGNNQVNRKKNLRA